MPRLADYAERQKEGLPTKLPEVLGIELVITDCTFTHSRYGEVAYFSATRKDTGESLTVMTGAMLVLDALKHANELGSFPLEAVFSRKGQTYIIE